MSWLSKIHRPKCDVMQDDESEHVLRIWGKTRRGANHLVRIVMTEEEADALAKLLTEWAQARRDHDAEVEAAIARGQMTLRS